MPLFKQGLDTFQVLALQLPVHCDAISKFNITQLNLITSLILDMYGLQLKKYFIESKSKNEFPEYFTCFIIRDSHNIANHFNEFFAWVDPRLSASITNNSANTVSSYLKQKIISFGFHYVSESAVCKILKDLYQPDYSNEFLM